MDPKEFEYFKDLMEWVWKKCHPEIEFKKPIPDYESKLLAIELDIEEKALARLHKNTPPITRRSLRFYTDNILEKSNGKINPKSRSKDILSRYVLGVKRLEGEELEKWDENKLYRTNEFWTKFKDLSAKNDPKSPISLYTRDEISGENERKWFNLLDRGVRFWLLIGTMIPLIFFIGFWVNNRLEKNNFHPTLTEISDDNIIFKEWQKKVDLANWVEKSGLIYGMDEPKEPWCRDEIAIELNKLILIKKSRNTKKIIMRMGHTENIPVVRCFTHQLRIIDNKKKIVYAPERTREWFLVFDVGKSPVDYPIVILYELIHKNQFQNNLFTEVEIDKEWEKVSVKIEFPKSKKFEYPINLYEFPLLEKTTLQEFSGLIDTFTEKYSNSFYWNIEAPKINFAYRARWGWR